MHAMHDSLHARMDGPARVWPYIYIRYLSETIFIPIPTRLMSGLLRDKKFVAGLEDRQSEESRCMPEIVRTVVRTHGVLSLQ